MEVNIRSSPWLPCLLSLTVLHLGLFAVFTYVQISQEHDVDEMDTSLQQRIEKLQDAISKHSEKRRKRSDNFITDMLIQQEKVLAQHCISRNKTCMKGVKGDLGMRGAQGMEGEKGETGISGNTGEAGRTGAEGYQGERGAEGLKGDVGLTGVKGVVGGVGEKGLSGPPGSKGEMGDTGLKGDRGIPGSRGQKGARGVIGVKGVRGVIGEPGRVGVQGVKGDTGEAGVDGTDIQYKPADGCMCITSRNVSTRALHNIYKFEEDSNTDRAYEKPASIITCNDAYDISKELIYEPGTHLIEVGSKLLLHCSNDIVGTEVTWYKNGKQITDTRMLKENDLIIHGFGTENQGTYRCKPKGKGDNRGPEQFVLLLNS